MSVPSFSDLGKSARDIFRTGYHYGKSLIKLTSKKTDETFEMSTDLSLDRDAMKLLGIANVEYKTLDYGSFLQKWSTDGTVLVGYLLNRTLIPDTGLVSELKYNASTAAKAIRIGANYNTQNFNAICSISSDMSSNVDVLGSVVTAFKGFTIGYRGGYSTERNKMLENNVEMAFTYRNVDFHFRCISIPSVYGLSLQYKVNSMWEAAIDSILVESGNIQRWTMGAAAKYKIDENSTFRCKFNNDLQLGMSLEQKLDKSVTVFLSCNVDCVNVTRGGHKVGLAVEINA